MFAKTIIDSDAFLDMSVTARLLYYDLSMRADDDGFVNSPKKIMRMVGASEDDLRMLAARKFIIPFDNGVVVIKHWRIHNYIRKDTYKETPYKEQKELLELDENNSYRLVRNGSLDVRGRSVDEPWTQDRLGKDRLGKDIGGGNNIDMISSTPPTIPEPSDSVLAGITEKWNAIPHTLSIDRVIPMTRRCDELRLCIDMVGLDGVLKAIDKVAESEYLKSRGSIAFDNYINRNAIQKLLEGNYDQNFKKAEKPKNSFNNFEQRNYSKEQMDKILFG